MSDRIGALYIRVSTDDQAELSPDAQKRLLLDYAKRTVSLFLMILSFPRVFPAGMFKSVLSFSV